MTTRRTTLVDGAWLDGGGEPFAVVNPATEAELAKVPASSVQQVDGAIAAARRAFDDEGSEWRQLDGADRGGVLDRLADRLEAQAEDLARLVVDEVGTPITLARSMQVRMPIANIRWFAEAARRGPRDGLEEVLPPLAAAPTVASVLRREPVGVVGAMTAYNYPLNLLAWKVAGALASGCPVVLMPSPRATLTTTRFVEAAVEAGLPAGALHLVVGGPAIGAHLASSPGIDLLSFTGSHVVGAQVMALAAGSLTRVVLELGGKSPNVVLPGTDIEAIVGPSVLRFCRNAGQGCGATTRTLVHRDEHDRLVGAMVGAMESLRVGDPLDEATDLGPVITAEHRARVEGYVERAVAAGADLLTGGARPAGLATGYYVAPTLIGGVEVGAEIAQEELFGPVGVVLPYDDVDDLVRQANATRFGLNANVWGPTDEALAVAARLRSGTVTVNGGGPMRPDAPWGGPGASGIGREMGEDGYREFFEVKHVQWPAAMSHW